MARLWLKGTLSFTFICDCGVPRDLSIQSSPAVTSYNASWVCVKIHIKNLFAKTQLKPRTFQLHHTTWKHTPKHCRFFVLKLSSPSTAAPYFQTESLSKSGKYQWYKESLEGQPSRIGAWCHKTSSSLSYCSAFYIWMPPISEKGGFVATWNSLFGQTRSERNAKITGGRAQTNLMIHNVTYYVLPWTLKLPSTLSFCVFSHVLANIHTFVFMTDIWRFPLNVNYSLSVVLK